MTDDTLYALVDDGGVVTNVIVADQNFIDTLTKNVNDHNVDTGPLSFANAYEVTGKEVGIGHKRSAKGQWIAPEPPVPTPEEIAAHKAAEEAAAARAADDKFLEALQKKARAGQSLTQDERDRMMVIQLARS